MQYIALLFLSAIFFTSAAFGSDQQEEVPTISAESPPIKYDNVVETVIIDTIRYQVPEPWTGNRQFPVSRNLDELRQIPREYTHQESEIYILAEAYDALVKMLEQAHQDGIDLKAESAYRSMNYQTRIFVRMLKQGRSFDDIVRYVAPPGYSQHMLGTALDFYPSNWEFAETAQYLWLQENGATFGFEETYSRNNRYRMPWEAWHWNYIGEPEGPEQTVADESAPGNNESETPETVQNIVTDGPDRAPQDIDFPEAEFPEAAQRTMMDGSEANQLEAEMPEIDDRG